jgi:hypothetical protein
MQMIQRKYPTPTVQDDDDEWLLCRIKINPFYIFFFCECFPSLLFIDEKERGCDER